MSANITWVRPDESDWPVFYYRPTNSSSGVMKLAARVECQVPYSTEYDRGAVPGGITVLMCDHSHSAGPVLIDSKQRCQNLDAAVQAIRYLANNNHAYVLEGYR